MEESEQTQSSYKISKYNSAVAQLMRLDDLWKDCHKHSRQGLYGSWSDDLDKIWSELAGDLNPGCDEEKQYIQFTKLLAEIGKLRITSLHGFTLPGEEYMDKRAKQYWILLQKEIWLKRLQNKLGKGTSYADEFEDDFD